MKLIILISVLMAQCSQADTVRIVYDWGEWESNLCQVLYSETSDLQIIHTPPENNNSFLFSEYYFACAQTPPTPLLLPTSRSNFFINGQKHKCPLLVHQMAVNVSYFEFYCADEVILKGGFE